MPALIPVGAITPDVLFVPVANGADPRYHLPQSITHTFAFNWLPLLALGGSATLEYITATLVINSHDTTEYQGLSVDVETFGSDARWIAGEVILTRGADFVVDNTTGPPDGCGNSGSHSPVITLPADIYIGHDSGDFFAGANILIFNLCTAALTQMAATTFSVTATFQNTCTFPFTEKYTTFVTPPILSLTNITAWVKFSGTPCAGCNPCVGCGRIQSGMCGNFCVSGSPGLPPGATGTGPWVIKNAAGQVVATNTTPNGWSVLYSHECTITVCAPCIQRPTPALLRYTIEYNDSSGAAISGCFDVVPQQSPCPGGAYTAVEMDSPRMWLHAGQGATLATYSQPDNVLQFSGESQVQKWVKLRADSRPGGALGMLGQSDTTNVDGDMTRVFSVWISRDGGATAERLDQVASQSSLIERDSERGYLLWFYTDAKNQVSLRQSKDWKTFDAEQPVMLDGKRMQATLIDSCQDGRNNGKIAMVIAPGTDPLAPVGSSKVVFSDDAGESFVTGLT